MGIKDTVRGWLSSTPDKADELEDAEADELTREYSADRADTIAGFELGGGPVSYTHLTLPTILRV